MSHYIAYDREVAVQWFNEDSNLREEVQKYKKRLTSEGIEDKYATLARIRVFYNVVCKNTQLLSEYNRRVAVKRFVPDIELVNQLDTLLRRVSWKRFFMALRFVIKRYIKLEVPGTINSRRLDKGLDKLREIPFTTVIPKQ